MSKRQAPKTNVKVSAHALLSDGSSGYSSVSFSTSGTSSESGGSIRSCWSVVERTISSFTKCFRPNQETPVNETKVIELVEIIKEDDVRSVKEEKADIETISDGWVYVDLENAADLKRVRQKEKNDTKKAKKLIVPAKYSGHPLGMDNIPIVCDTSPRYIK